MRPDVDCPRALPIGRCGDPRRRFSATPHPLVPTFRVGTWERASHTASLTSLIFVKRQKRSRSLAMSP